MVTKRIEGVTENQRASEINNNNTLLNERKPKAVENSEWNSRRIRIIFDGNKNKK